MYDTEIGVVVIALKFFKKHKICTENKTKPERKKESKPTKQKKALGLMITNNHPLGGTIIHGHGTAELISLQWSHKLYHPGI